MHKCKNPIKAVELNAPKVITPMKVPTKHQVLALALCSTAFA